MTLPHMSSRTPLRSSLHHRSTSSYSLPLAVMAAGLNPKRNRNRTTVLALLALISLSAYVFFSHYPMSLSPSYRLRRADTSVVEQMVAVSPVDSTRSSRAAAKKHKPVERRPIALTTAQELAAVSGFLASLPQNVIPPSVDPSHPIDPDLVLDFDTRSQHAMEEVERVVEDVWARNPVMLYGKLHSPVTREIKSILSNMYLRPPPLYIDVDTRDDAEVLTPMLTRLTSSPDLPILLIAGEPITSMTQIRSLLANGELQRLLTAAGTVVGGGKRRKHKK